MILRPAETMPSSPATPPMPATKMDRGLCSKMPGFGPLVGDVSCPGLGTHDFTDSQSYSLTHSPTGVAAALQATSRVVLPTGVSSIDIAGQSGWKYCNRCHVLAFSAGNSCVDGKPHDLAGSNYTVGNNSLDYTTCTPRLWPRPRTATGWASSGSSSTTSTMSRASICFWYRELVRSIGGHP